MQQWASGQGALEKKEGWLIEKAWEDEELNIATSIIDSIYLVISSHFTLIITFNPCKNPRGRNYNYLHFTDKYFDQVSQAKKQEHQGCKLSSAAEPVS